MRNYKKVAFSRVLSYQLKRSTNPPGRQPLTLENTKKCYLCKSTKLEDVMPETRAQKVPQNKIKVNESKILLKIKLLISSSNQSQLKLKLEEKHDEESQVKIERLKISLILSKHNKWQEKRTTNP